MFLVVGFNIVGNIFFQFVVTGVIVELNPNIFMSIQTM